MIYTVFSGMKMVFSNWWKSFSSWQVKRFPWSLDISKVNRILYSTDNVSGTQLNHYSRLSQTFQLLVWPTVHVQLLVYSNWIGHAYSRSSTSTFSCLVVLEHTYSYAVYQDITYYIQQWLVTITCILNVKTWFHFDQS